MVLSIMSSLQANAAKTIVDHAVAYKFHHCQVLGRSNLALQPSHFLVSKYNAIFFNFSIKLPI
jgi:hypothetical protein